MCHSDHVLQSKLENLASREVLPLVYQSLGLTLHTSNVILTNVIADIFEDMAAIKNYFIWPIPFSNHIFLTCSKQSLQIMLYHLGCIRCCTYTKRLNHKQLTFFLPCRSGSLVTDICRRSMYFPRRLINVHKTQTALPNGQQ